MVSLFSIVCAIVIISTNSQKILECADLSECASSTLLRKKLVTCSGANSCELSPICSNVTATSSVTCSGSSSCASSPMLKANKDLNCNGYESCANSDSNVGKMMDCPGSFSCKMASSMSAGGMFYCGGYSSCWGISSLIADKSVNCEGQHGCWNANIDANDDVYCNGEHSCDSANIITTGSIICGGNLCGFFATFTATESIKLYGSESGRSATITDTPLIEAYGKESLYGAFIDSGSLSAMTIKSYGHYSSLSGSGAVVICRDGAVCNLDCIGTGCKGLEYECESGATCNIEPIQCTEYGNSGQSLNIGGIVCDCPICTSSANAKSVVIKKPGQQYMTNYGRRKQNAIDPAQKRECNQENSCSGQTIQSDKVICAGSTSCSSSQISTDNLVCGGSESCYLGDVQQVADGICDCSGEASCKLATITSNWVDCSGRESCCNSTLTVSSQFSCSGTSSCKVANIVNNGKNTYCSGDRACDGATIESALMITCNANYGCSSSELIAGTNIVCDGSYSCYSSTMSLTNNFYSNGYNAASESIIYSGTSIEGNGYLSLSDSTIDSTNKPQIKVFFYGHLSGNGATIKCRANSKCIVNCFGTGCKDMIYECESGANCVVRPTQCKTQSNYQGIDCPAFVNNAYNMVDAKIIENVNNNQIFVNYGILLVVFIVFIIFAVFYKNCNYGGYESLK